MGKIDWAARKAAALARENAADGALSEQDKAEIAAREEEAAIIARARKAEIVLDLARRLDAVIEATGLAPGALMTLTFPDFPDTFIIQRDGRAHGKYKRALEGSGEYKGKKDVDTNEAERTYVIASVYDWNGVTDWSDGDSASKLREFLRACPGVCTSLANAAGRLNGVGAEERKSASEGAD